MSSMDAPVSMPVVPARLRFVLYWTSYFLSMAAGLISLGWQIIAAASPDVSAPLWVRLAPPLLLLVVAQLNGLSGNNVTDRSTVVVRRDEGGAVDLALIYYVLGSLFFLVAVLNLLGVGTRSLF